MEQISEKQQIIQKIEALERQLDLAKSNGATVTAVSLERRLADLRNELRRLS
ncbi:MAG: hypothetical protein ACRCYY_00340 [Trueperaceae bacterium]